MSNKLSEFLAEIQVKSIAEEIALKANKDSSHITELLSVYINEAKRALIIVEPYLDKKLRILEVGSGLCLLSFFLASEGYDITADEPSIGGFSLFNIAKKVIARHFESVKLEIVDKPAGLLSVESEGEFDLIFSNNVMEHIPDLNGALEALIAVLSEDGIMVHNCPNYLFPYEPHFGIPVFRRFKKVTEKIFSRRVNADRELWDSLNFVNIFDVRSFCKRNGLRVVFKDKLLFETFERMGNDPLFLERHNGGIISIVYKILLRSRTLFLLKYLPSVVVTPMQFEIRKPKNT